jgi:hypothetical protein
VTPLLSITRGARILNWTTGHRMRHTGKNPGLATPAGLSYWRHDYNRLSTLFPPPTCPTNRGHLSLPSFLFSENIQITKCKALPHYFTQPLSHPTFLRILGSNGLSKTLFLEEAYIFTFGIPGGYNVLCLTNAYDLESSEHKR